MSHNNILECVKEFLKSESISDYNVRFTGKSKQDEGYTAKVIFATIVARTATRDRKMWNLAIKISTECKLLRSQMPIQQLSEKEIHIYEHVIPSFKQFQREMGLQQLNFAPNCYFTKQFEGCEVLFLENLRARGFGMWDRKTPMTEDYIRLVLQAYGLWHALSLALKLKKPEAFKNLTKNNINMFPNFLLKGRVDAVIYRYFEHVRSRCTSCPDVELAKFSQNDVKNMLVDVFSTDPDFHVILHGDSWTNNFMFKLEEITKQPTEVCIIDWQCSGIGSPVLDLSFFIYACVDTQQHIDVKELLRIYHKNLSDYLLQMGCDPSKIFSYDKLIEHWQKFSKYGLLLAAFLLKFSVCESAEALNFMETAEQGKEFWENFDNFNHLVNEEVYFNRVKNNILHYVRNVK